MPDFKRIMCLASTEGGIYVSSMLALNELWYKGYPRSSFHFFNDNKEWLQMDKAGHVFSAYTVGRMGINLLHWSGVTHKKAVWYGGLTGFVFQGSVELMDGFSSQWGFSWGDILANSLGTGILISQELLFRHQPLTVKYSMCPSKYSAYRPEVLGNNLPQQFFKDYNAQTYWLSLNIASFIKGKNNFPKWLNLALGYGADGMTGGHDNPSFLDGNGNAIVFRRYRQYYISLDVDLTKIKTQNPVLKAVFNTFSFIKIPFPTLEMSQGNLKTVFL